MIRDADVVVIGAGGFGAATAYHLVRRGVRRVALLDRDEVGSQTSPRAAGLTSKVASTEVMVRLVDEAVERLARFEAETGRRLGWRRVGAMRVVLTESGEAAIRHNTEVARAAGVPVEILSGSEAERLAPHFRAGPARLITFSPQDGYFEPPLVAPAFAGAAADGGATVLTHTEVTAILHHGGRVGGVSTPRGDIRAAVVVDAAGAWARMVGHLAGARVPVVPTRHQLFITAPLPGLLPSHPIVRIHEPSVYTRPASGGLMLGGYEDEPLQLDPARQAAGFRIADVPLDVAVLRGLAAEVKAHFPDLDGIALQEHRGGLPTMSPDGRHIVGPVPGVAGLFLATACNVGGLSISASVGRALADLIVDGHSEPDLGLFAVDRFQGRFETEAALADACRDQYGRKYTKA
jgi:glycine/D-amino acid oxidase-like deaminating enzyme